VALEAFSDAEADSDMGQDLGLDLTLENSARRASDPANLAEYCAGPPKEPALGEGTKVKANWGGYGEMYPGKVSDENKDGTVDIKYNDGFTEKNVDPEELKIRKKQSKGNGQAKAPAGANPADDPACKLQDFLQKLQKQLKDLNKMMSQWLAAQRAKIAGEKLKPVKPPPTAAPPVAPGGVTGTAAPASKDQAGELEKLKAQLSDLDAYIKELEKQEAGLDKKLQEKLGGGAAPAPADGVKTVDMLIAEYRAKILQRQTRVQELLLKIAEHQAELARLGESQISLQDIDDMVKQLEADMEEGKKKRDELEKAGELDPELEAVVDGIIKSLSKMRKKVNNLLGLEEKAKAEAEREAAEEAAEAAAARKKAREEGRDEDEAEAEARAAAKKRSAEKRKKAEMATMGAAQDMQKDMNEAEKGAKKLDTGLHPHGDKWWRYRYERSYIEALLMIFISIIMLIWSDIVRRMRHYIKVKSLPAGAALKTEWEEVLEEADGTMLLLWLHYLADQMLVCIFCFLTVWLIAKTSLIDVFPEVIKPASDMHVPHTGLEYRTMALDICTIFFFAIIFYFGLMFSVAQEVTKMTVSLGIFEKATSSARTAALAPVNRYASRSFSLAENADKFANTEKHFVKHIREYMKVRNDPELAEISRLLNDDWNNFPLAKYLQINLKMTSVQLMSFSWQMWVPIIGLFLGLCCAHRFAHLGYVRIMGVASLVVLLIMVGIVQTAKRVSEAIDAQSETDEDTPRDGSALKLSSEPTFHEKYSTEQIILGLLEFSLFFVCYGVARMICQPWMWELHFWPVFILSIVAVLSSIVFVVWVAPVIPSFLCAMALPPYVDSENKQIMKFTAIGSGPTPGK